MGAENVSTTYFFTARWLYVFFFVALKFLIVKNFLRKEELGLPSQPWGISIPRKMLFGKLIGEDDEEDNEGQPNILRKLLGQTFSYWFSVYSIYKALKKYREVKYIVSITRVSSRLTGFICRLYVPKPIRYVFYGSFAKFYGLNMSEVEQPDFGAYESFTQFFTRRLKAGVRQVVEPQNGRTMCSPCDGRVLTCGKINSEYSTIDCVKGRSYRLDEFMLGQIGNQDLGDDQTCKVQNNSELVAMLDKVKQRGNQLLYTVIYLSPADYHRFHSPAIHSADFRRHVVGYLSPVKPSHVNKHKDVFKNNERVNIFGRWAQGFYFESAVGATNVGSIKLDFDEDVLTNQSFPRYPFFEDKTYLQNSSKSGPFFKYLLSSDE